MADGIAHIEIGEIVRVEAVGGIGLDINLEDLIELVEKIYIS